VATRVLADEDLEALRGFPEIGREELARFFTLTPADVAFIDPGRGRGPADRMGLAAALCSLPWLGFVPDDVAAAPQAAVVRLAGQLQVDPDALRLYGRRAKTRTEHLRLAARYLGRRAAGPLELKELDEFLLARALEHDSPLLLFRLACEYLISARVIRPGPVMVVERVAHAREHARRETFDRLADQFTESRCAQLDGLLVTDPAVGMTRLRWLETGPVEASPAAVKAEVAKLEFLRQMGARTLDLSVLPAERRRFLATAGRRMTAQALTRREPHRRYPILLALVVQSAAEVLDEVVQLFDQAVSARESKAARKMRDALAERGRAGEDRQVLLDSVLAIAADPAIPDEQVGGLIRGGSDRVGTAACRPRCRLPPAATRPRPPGRFGGLLRVSAAVHPAGDRGGPLRRRHRCHRAAEDDRGLAGTERQRRPEGPRRRAGQVRAGPLARLPGGRGQCRRASARRGRPARRGSSWGADPAPAAGPGGAAAQSPPPATAAPPGPAAALVNRVPAAQLATPYWPIWNSWSRDRRRVRSLTCGNAFRWRLVVTPLLTGRIRSLGQASECA
jgi:hypothetical protein